MHYSPLATGLALIPFALAASLGSTVIARRLMARVAPRRLIGAGVALSATGLLPLLGLTASRHRLPLIMLAEVIEGIGTGLAGPSILNTALRGVAKGGHRRRLGRLERGRAARRLDRRRSAEHDRRDRHGVPGRRSRRGGERPRLHGRGGVGGWNPLCLPHSAVLAGRRPSAWSSSGAVG
jgi:hypothetical protein